MILYHPKQYAMIFVANSIMLSRYSQSRMDNSLEILHILTSHTNNLHNNDIFGVVYDSCMPSAFSQYFILDCQEYMN